MNVFECKNCPKRHVGCHATCESYLRGKEEMKRIDRNRKAESEINGYAKDSIARREHKRHRQ